MIENHLKAEFTRRMQNESLMRIEACLDHMTEDNIWYAPNKNVNSVGNIVLHLCGNIRQYIISTFTSQEDNRKRSLEFSQHKSHNKEELKQKISETILESAEIVSGLNLLSFKKEFEVQGFKELGVNIIVHVIEHTSYHTGQITTICKWLEDVDTKYYAGLDLDKTS